MEERKAAGIAIYIREDSRLADGGEQLALCREYAALHYGREAADSAVVYRDSFSPAERPGMDAMMDAARRGGLGAIVCAGLGHLCYGSAELASLLGELGEHAVTLAAVEDRLNTDTPLGRTMACMAAALSELDRKGAARRVRDSMLELARTGRWLGGVPPTGYKSRKLSARSGGTEYALVTVPGEIAVVRRIFDVFLERNALTAVERDLREAGIRSKNGRAYSRFSIRQILENPVYALADGDTYRYFEASGAEICSPPEQFDGTRAMMVYNKTIQQRGAVKSRDISRWIVAVGRHEGAVSGADWVRAQRQLGQNKPGAFRKPRSANALLSGLLRCGECGAFMRPKQTRRTGEDGEPVFIYLCERKEHTRGQECRMRNVSGNLLDRVVCDQLRSLSPGSAAFLAQLERNRRMTEPALDRMEQKRLEDRRGQIEKSISDLVFSLIKTIDKSAYDYIIRQIDKLHEENAAIQKRIGELDALAGPHPLAAEQADAARELLESFRSGFDAMTVERRRTVLRALVERVVWDGRRAQVYLFGADAGTADVNG